VGTTLVVLWLSGRLLHAPRADLILLGVFLLASGSITLAVGYFGIHFGMARLLGTIRGKLIFILLLASALALGNVGFTSYLMFISPHDLAVLSLLLIFALGMSAFLALALSQSIHETISALVQAVRSMGSGNLQTRVKLNSHDELEEVARAFNTMAEQLEAAFEKQKELEQARRQVVAAVSHDLRTPLSAMRVMVESINDGVVSEPETVGRYLRTLQAEIKYLSQLIDDLFEISQIDLGLLALHQEQASVADLISDTLESLSVQAQQQRLVLKGEADDTLPLVVMDSRRVQRVLYNLLHNAFRHTPADGTIVIRAVDAGQEVQVSVADTGEGIPAEELPRIFERFYRRDRARSRSQGGSGLGLNIAKGIVEAHGGRIWAESIPGQGTTFTFSLPKAARSG
jgi:signal transduction histidine kinase